MHTKNNKVPKLHARWYINAPIKGRGKNKINKEQLIEENCYIDLHFLEQNQCNLHHTVFITYFFGLQEIYNFY